ncbi:ABC-three component system middle component 6 [Lactobacillus amylovorus]|uniref:ABC-three component system middle component 6 n=1 Tax=Lactobacillus amylovorus TaxID=1604 RepID=UPI001F9FC83C|nr:hypothetical protein [Candidatus Dwaynia gallinarum]
MILVNKMTSPENTVYFIAAVLNGILNECGNLDYSELYKALLKKIHKTKFNTNTFTLAVDFLFLLDKISINKEGKIYVSKNTAFGSE